MGRSSSLSTEHAAAARRPPRRAADRHAVDRRATTVAAAVGALLTLAIYLGSRGLLDFDVALVGYAVATVVMVFGLVYRTMVWVRHPPTRRAVRRGLSS
ncbi:MAG: MFS transporter, partial [Actinomycetota bacterium]